MEIGARLALAGLGLGAGLQGATQFVAWSFGHAPALGPAWRISVDLALYWPWSVLIWLPELQGPYPNIARAAGWVILLGCAAGLVGGRLEGQGPSGRPRWGGLSHARKAGLRRGRGCVLGELHGRLLATDDPRPSLVTGGTRSGKGRGHVVPTLLSWEESALVHDPKGELWQVSAGYRAKLSHAFFFDPRSPSSARWNPLAEITPGPGELAQVQRLVAILSDPGGQRNEEAIWDKAACEILEAVVLHVLYAAKDEEKTLLSVRDLLADLDASAEIMARTLHHAGPDGQARCHPFIALAVQGYASMHDRFRTSVQGTARSYLKWLAGEDVERALCASDFSMSDLMCAQRPVSLYLQLAPADAAALRPLLRLAFHAATQALTADLEHSVDGRRKTHKLLLVMDEFPLLGRLEFFEKSLRLMSGYGLKAMLVAQSLNDIVETYGPHNTIIDNCHVFTAFSALDPLTQEKVSRLAGASPRRHVSRSSSGLLSSRASVTVSEMERPRLAPAEIGALSERDQLVFTAGAPPILARKLRYDRRSPFRSRALLAPPDQAMDLDVPPMRPHPWHGRSALGQADVALPLSKDVEGAISDKRTRAKVEEVVQEFAQAYLATDAILDHLKGLRHEDN
jgi:type IV secretion system protein VirD4